MEGLEEGTKISCNGLSQHKVAELLQPVIEIHDIVVKDNCIEFVGISPCLGVPENEESNGNKAIIEFADISFISQFKARIEVLLRSGELYTFSKTECVRTHIDTHNGFITIQPTTPITAQEISKNIWIELEKKLKTK